MKVLALIPDFIKKPTGGLGEQARFLLEELKSKIDFYVVGYPEKNELDHYRFACNLIPIFNHGYLSTFLGQGEYFLQALKHNIVPDIIHAFDYTTFYAGVLCSRFYKKPLITSLNLSVKGLNLADIHTCYDKHSFDGSSINQLFTLIEELGFIQSNKIITVSEYYGNLLYPFKDKIKVIKNGINLNEWVKKRAPKLPGKNNIRCCYIGRAATMKGIDTIINCTIPNDIDFYFVVPNVQAEPDIINQIKNKCNNKNIFYIPGLYGQDKIDFLYAMDAVVIPSRHEPFGIVALEALASENIIITTNTGGIKEALDNYNYQIEIQTSYDLQTAFVKLPEMLQFKESITKRGKDLLQSYSWDNVAKKYLEVYREVINEDYIPLQTLKVLGDKL